MTNKFFEGLSPIEAYDIGESVGRYQAEEEAAKAYEMGEIEMWLEWTTPKTMEEWEAWDEKYGEGFGKRWKV